MATKAGLELPHAQTMNSLRLQKSITERIGGRQVQDALWIFEDALLKPGVGINSLDLKGFLAGARFMRDKATSIEAKEARAEELLTRYLQPSNHLWAAVQAARSEGVPFHNIYRRVQDVKPRKNKKKNGLD